MHPNKSDKIEYNQLKSWIQARINDYYKKVINLLMQ